MKTIHYKGKGEHSIHELEKIADQYEELLHQINSGQFRPTLSGEVTDRIANIIEKHRYNAGCSIDSKAAAESILQEFSTLLKPQEPGDEQKFTAAFFEHDIIGRLTKLHSHAKSSVEHFVKTGKVTGSFYLFVKQLAKEMSELTPPQEQRQGLSEEKVLRYLNINLGDKPIHKKVAKAICQLSAPTSEEREKCLSAWKSKDDDLTWLREKYEKLEAEREKWEAREKRLENDLIHWYNKHKELEAELAAMKEQNAILLRRNNEVNEMLTDYHKCVAELAELKDRLNLYKGLGDF